MGERNTVIGYGNSVNNLSIEEQRELHDKMKKEIMERLRERLGDMF